MKAHFSKWDPLKGLISYKKEKEARGFRNSSSHTQKVCSERGGGGGVDVRIKSYAGWTGSVFLCFSTKVFCTCCWSLSWGCGAWCGALVLGVVV